MGTKANIRARMKEKRIEPHEHFTAGDTGYIPRGVGQINLKILKR